MAEAHSDLCVFASAFSWLWRSVRGRLRETFPGGEWMSANTVIWLLCVCVYVSGQFCGPLRPEHMWKWDQLCNKRQKCPFQNKMPPDCCMFTFTQDSLGFLFKKKETAPGVSHSYGIMKCLEYLLGRLILNETGSTESTENTQRSLAVGLRRDK